MFCLFNVYLSNAPGSKGCLHCLSVSVASHGKQAETWKVWISRGNVSWCVDISESAFWTTLAKIKRQVSKSFGAKPPCQDTLFLLTLNRIHGLVEDLEVADRVGGGTASSKRSGCQQDDTWLTSECGWVASPVFREKSYNDHLPFTLGNDNICPFQCFPRDHEWEKADSYQHKQMTEEKGQLPPPQEI